MKCAEARRLMQAIIAGDAATADEERLAEHVQACPECAEQWRAMMSLTEALQAAEPAELALQRDLAEEVVGEIAAASRTEQVDAAEVPVCWVDRVFGSRLAQAVGAVVFVAICLGLLMVTSPSMGVLTGTLASAGTVPMP